MKLYTRWGNEWHYASEFIRPDDGMVVECFEEITAGISDPEDQALACWQFVLEEIDYPLTLVGESTDVHVLNAYLIAQGLFGSSYHISYSQHEFFKYPSEVLGQVSRKTGRRMGDCDDTAILLTSLIRRGLREDRVKTVIGNSIGSRNEADHAWVECLIQGEWLIMETTLASLPSEAVSRAASIAGIAGGEQCYLPFMSFNDEDIKEDIPFTISNRRNESIKLGEIAAIWGWPTKR